MQVAFHGIQDLLSPSHRFPVERRLLLAKAIFMSVLKHEFGSYCHMNVWGASALIFYRPIVMIHISEDPFFKHSLNNCIYKSMKILHNSKGISKHHFEV